jgi:hypothetical protein
VLDLDSVATTFAALTGCYERPRKGEGLRHKFNLHDPHLAADAWLAASPEERESQRETYAEKLRAKIRYLAQEITNRRLRANDYVREWRKKNPQRVREQQARSRAKRPEQLKQYHAERRARNRVALREKAREYREKNREKIRVALAAWRSKKRQGET